jgi:putative peptide zinc metalloprotease protein
MTTVPSTPPSPRWSRADGVQSLGSLSGSGLVDPTYLVKRGQGQMLQVSELLNLVIREMLPDRGPDEVAEAVSQEFGRRLTRQALEPLITATLRPLGLVVDCHEEGRSHAAPPRANQLLSLRFRGTMLPERLVNVLADWLRPFFHPPVVALSLVALVAMEVLLVMHGNVVEAIDQVLDVPVLVLALILQLVLGD